MPASLFFSAKGRLSPPAFWRGYIILGVIGVLLTLMAAFVNFNFSVLSVVMIYPGLCLLIKRCHDAGKSAGYAFILAFMGAIIWFVVSGIAMGLFVDPETYLSLYTKLQDGLQKVMARQLEVSALSSEIQTLQRMTLYPNLIAYIALMASTGYLAARQPRDPEGNAYGPYTL